MKLKLGLKLSIILVILIVSLLTSRVLGRNILKVDIEVPPGTGNFTLVQPNSTIFGYIVLESQVSKMLSCYIHISTSGCVLHTGHTYRIRFHFKYDAKVIYVNLTVVNRLCIVRVRATCDNHSVAVSKVLKASAENVTAELILPSDSLCHFESKFEPYVLVIKSFRSPILNLLSGIGKTAHPDFLGYGCIKVSGNGTYSAVLIFKTLNGKLVPISVTGSLFEAQSLSKPGIIVLSGFTGYVVFPLFAQTDPRDLVGTYIVDLYVYRYGSERPILHKVYKIRIVVLDQAALELIMFSGLVAVPFFLLVLARSLRRVSLKELLLCALTACLIFTTAILPGYVLWGISAALGPFDWIVYGIAWCMIRMIYYAAIVMITQRPGVFTLLMFIVWILSTLFFGRLSIVSLLWVATSSLLYEPLLYITGVTRGRPTMAGLLTAFAIATPIDNYVDLMLYMFLYRLYYADWYVMMYVAGTSIYSMIGALLGAKLSRDIRVIIHE